MSLKHLKMVVHIPDSCAQLPQQSLRHGTFIFCQSFPDTFGWFAWNQIIKFEIFDTFQRVGSYCSNVPSTIKCHY